MNYVLVVSGQKLLHLTHTLMPQNLLDPKGWQNISTFLTETQKSTYLTSGGWNTTRATLTVLRN